MTGYDIAILIGLAAALTVFWVFLSLCKLAMKKTRMSDLEALHSREEEK